VLYKRKKRNWTKGDTALLSIGQGEILVTPLQAAMYCAALANGGKLLRPYLVSEVVDSQGHAVLQSATVVRHRLNVKEEHLAIIREGMVNAVQMPRGSAKVMKECGMAVAAKTGTAEVQGRDGKFKNTWLMCYGPLSQPKYAMVCLIEHGVSGGRTAGPLVAEFLKKWLE
jgi:penicillin-binding protein 2